MVQAVGTVRQQRRKHKRRQTQQRQQTRQETALRLPRE
jgi:hypothetical protein